jgi:hypothetical protein
VTSANESTGTANCGGRGGSRFNSASGTTFACNGAQGAPGTPGAPGTARAYAMVSDGSCFGGPPADCVASNAKNVNGVQRLASNIYCVDVAGINRTTSPTALVDVYFGDTDAPVNQALAFMAPFSGDCPDTNDFEVLTMRIGSDNLVNNVSFTIAVL